MNVEYDHIRAVMAEHHDLWERFKYMYWYKKYYSYDMTLKRIGNEFRKEYVQRISKEFKRGMLRGEIDSRVFTDFAWRRINLLINDPDRFYDVFFYNMDMPIWKRFRKRVGAILPASIKRFIKKILIK